MVVARGVEKQLATTSRAMASVISLETVMDRSVYNSCTAAALKGSLLDMALVNRAPDSSPSRGLRLGAPSRSRGTERTLRRPASMAAESPPPTPTPALGLALGLGRGAESRARAPAGARGCSAAPPPASAGLRYAEIGSCEQLRRAGAHAAGRSSRGAGAVGLRMAACTEAMAESKCRRYASTRFFSSSCASPTRLSEPATERSASLRTAADESSSFSSRRRWRRRRSSSVACNFFSKALVDSAVSLRRASTCRASCSLATTASFGVADVEPLTDSATPST
mmetsp:Transcript_69967/g.197445  ORF Transcript_69967/g.197445 Transcript_69967/m.197445 type:complete len:281 (-) Transcript_69967:735-1577(-)